MKRLIGICILMMASSPALAAGAASLSRLQVVEIDHNRYIAAADVNNIAPQSRVILGDANDYKRMNLPFPANVLQNAQLTYIQVNDHSAAIRIDNLLRSASNDYYLVLKQPDTSHLYAYIIRNYAKGTFNARVVAQMNYGPAQDLPRLAAVPPSTTIPAVSQPQDQQAATAQPTTAGVVAPASDTTTGFPSYPAPSIGTYTARPSPPSASQAPVTVEQASPQACAEQPAPTDNGLIAITSPALQDFAAIATKYLKDASIVSMGNMAYLKVPAPQHQHAMNVASNVSEQPTPAYEAASYSPDSGESFTSTTSDDPFFGWTKTVKYVVKKEDTSISDVVAAIKRDPTISTDAAIAAIWKMNKDSFGDQTIYTLEKGAVLDIPPRYVVMAIQNNPSQLRKLIEQATGQYPAY